MRNGNKTYYLLLFIVVIGMFISCRSRKNITKNDFVQTTEQTMAAKTDTTRTEKFAETTETRKMDETDNSYIRTTEYDTSGFVLRVQEEWRNIGRAELAVRSGTERDISLSGLSTITVSRKDSIEEESIIDKSTTDSRPVQGFEWFWLVIGIGVLLAIAGYFIFRKYKIK